MILKMTNTLILMICVLLSIAFFTLMERKYISFFQNRKGPNKTLISGIMQPISDAIKLLGKEMNMNIKSNSMMFLLSPCANLMCSLIVWLIFPFKFEFAFMKMSSLFMLSCMSMNMISLMMMGWASNSNYAFIGMVRTISQLVSYEINLMLVIITVITVTSQMNFKMMWLNQLYSPMMIFILPLFFVWMLTILAETNRTPFDFSEGESELVSGFNIEYSSKSFMMLFLAEYASILLMSMITTCMFCVFQTSNIMFLLIYFMNCLYFIWTRATFPRFRYDKLMKMNWTQILPVTTYILYYSMIYKIYCTTKS
uniref:NADH-ubiquinone oxidoreductase chain 1 n=1 Tax=Crenidorsum turpiniae TaxID=2774091 RepID=A0A7L7SCX8_9HEMI|nr:NADH dehydrogenase subunit 1 [Crenidorsum turpiniae]QNV48541.1 NADH dehydrogenase subunit 1 [Crenidorsum turpiniae]